jgi:hypothetical protein
MVHFSFFHTLIDYSIQLIFVTSSKLRSCHLLTLSTLTIMLANGSRGPHVWHWATIPTSPHVSSVFTNSLLSPLCCMQIKKDRLLCIHGHDFLRLLRSQTDTLVFHWQTAEHMEKTNIRNLWCTNSLRVIKGCLGVQNNPSLSHDPSNYSRKSSNQYGKIARALRKNQSFIFNSREKLESDDTDCCLQI